MVFLSMFCRSDGIVRFLRCVEKAASKKKKISLSAALGVQRVEATTHDAPLKAYPRAYLLLDGRVVASCD